MPCLIRGSASHGKPLAGMVHKGQAAERLTPIVNESGFPSTAYGRKRLFNSATFYEQNSNMHSWVWWMVSARSLADDQQIPRSLSRL